MKRDEQTLSPVEREVCCSVVVLSTTSLEGCDCEAVFTQGVRNTFISL